MKNFSAMVVTTQEIIDFLQRDLHMQEIHQAIVSQRIIDQAANEAGIIVRPEEIQAELDRMQYKYRLDHPTQLLEWFASQMTTLSKVERRIQEKLLSKKLASYFFLEQIEAHFSHDPKSFEQILLYEIVVPYEALAREIFYQIEEDEISFFEAAHIYHLDESRRLVCGFIGKKLRSHLAPEVAASILDAQPGEIIGPIRMSENRFSLLLLDEVFSPELTPEISDILIEELFQAWLHQKLAEHPD